MNYLRHLILTYDKKQLDLSRSYWFSYYLYNLSTNAKVNHFNIKVSKYNFVEHFRLDNELLTEISVKNKLVNLNSAVISNKELSYPNNSHLSGHKLTDSSKLKLDKFLLNESGESTNYHLTNFVSPLKFTDLNTINSAWDSGKYFLFKKGNTLYTKKNISHSLLTNINIYFLRKERLYTKLKYSRVASYDIVSGGFAAFFSGFIGFLILEKFGHELPDSGDFWYLVMYLVVLRLTYKAIAFGLNKDSNLLYIFSLKVIWFYLYNLYFIIVTLVRELIVNPLHQKLF